MNWIMQFKQLDKEYTEYCLDLIHGLILSDNIVYNILYTIMLGVKE